jgi:tubulin delta
MSLAGGTGSGLGSRVIEEFADIFQEVHQNVIAIFPNKTGETPLQHYNTLLSTAHI